MAALAKDWSRDEILKRSAPFAGIALLAWLTVPISAGEADFVLIGISAALMAAGVVVVLLIPWSRFPRWMTPIPPYVGLLVVALIRHAAHGASSGYGVLALVPVLWLALYGTRRELIVMIAAVGLTFVVPIFAFGEPEYPADEWRRTLLVTALAAFIGLTTQHLVAQSRLHAVEAERRARYERQREAYLRTVMNTASEGIVAIDSHGHFTFVNPSAAAMLGFSVRELRGRGMHELVHHSYPDGTPYPSGDCPILETLRTGRENVVRDEVYWRADGSSFPVEYRAAPMIESGEITGVVVTFTDISERLAVERAKNEFVSVVSHELRTPLTSIRGSLGLMEGGVLGELSEDSQRMLSIAISNTDRLVRLINDILDVERIESGKAPMQMRPCQLADLMASTGELLAPSAGEAGVRLEVRPVRARLRADPDRIVQTLVNLIGNAIKFSPAGGEVTVTGEAKDGTVCVQVRDQGPGIPAEKRETIFDRFAQLDSADARQKGGSGLGLAIARGIVEQHGGRIWVESGVGEGSTFAFELPTIADASDGDGQADGGRLRALVVEDDEDLAAVLMATLRRHEVSARHVADVDHALELLREQSPEVIVLDLMLPGRPGEVLIDWLRSEGRLGQSAIVVYTARDLDPDELAELRSVAEVITKSRVSAQEFEGRLTEILQRVGAGASGPPR